VGANGSDLGGVHLLRRHLIRRPDRCEEISDDEDFGVFSIFWSLGFFAAAVSSAPVEQELARSVAVQLERGRNASPEISAGVRTIVVGSAFYQSLPELLFAAARG
jgi:hypothetical protein